MGVVHVQISGIGVACLLTQYYGLNEAKSNAISYHNSYNVLVDFLFRLNTVEVRFPFVVVLLSVRHLQ